MMPLRERLKTTLMLERPKTRLLRLLIGVARLAPWLMRLAHPLAIVGRPSR